MLHDLFLMCEPFSENSKMLGLRIKNNKNLKKLTKRGWCKQKIQHELMLNLEGFLSLGPCSIPL